MTSDPIAYWTNLFKNGLRTSPSTLESLRKNNIAVGLTQAASHTMSPETVDSIRATQSRGLKVIDLDPNLLDKFDFAVQYDDSILANLVGEGTSSTNTDGSGPAASVKPYWRTFQFDCPGTWVKIETLPVRIESGRGLSTTSYENPVNLSPQNTSSTTNPSVIAEASRRVILLDFEAPTAAPHLVRPGQIFRTDFSSVLITVKQLNVRLRITIGTNSEIEANHEPQHSLSLFGGRGITTDYQLAPIPFSMGHRDVVSSQALGVPLVPGILNSSLTNLLYSPDVSIPLGTPIGASVFFLTGFWTRAFVRQSVAAEGLYSVELFLMNYNLVTLAPTTQIKRICSLDLVAYQNVQGTDQVNLQLAEPIRVMIPPMTCVALKISEIIDNGSPDIVYFRFGLDGYVLGGFSANTTSGLSNAPFQTTVFMKENAWPMDFAFNSIPNR